MLMKNHPIKKPVTFCVNKLDYLTGSDLPG